MDDDASFDPDVTPPPLDPGLRKLWVRIAMVREEAMSAIRSHDVRLSTLDGHSKDPINPAGVVGDILKKMSTARTLLFSVILALFGSIGGVIGTYVGIKEAMASIIVEQKYQAQGTSELKQDVREMRNEIKGAVIVPSPAKP